MPVLGERGGLNYLGVVSLAAADKVETALRSVKVLGRWASMFSWVITIRT